MVLASEPVCICGVDVAAPQQLRARNSQHKMSMAELRSIFSRQFTEYEVDTPHHACYAPVRSLKEAISFGPSNGASDQLCAPGVRFHMRSGRSCSIEQLRREKER